MKNLNVVVNLANISEGENFIKSQNIKKERTTNNFSLLENEIECSIYNNFGHEESECSCKSGKHLRRRKLH